MGGNTPHNWHRAGRQCQHCHSVSNGAPWLLDVSGGVSTARAIPLSTRTNHPCRAHWTQLTQESKDRAPVGLSENFPRWMAA